ncbi:MAG TPA: hypothetical protein VFX16_13945 [Pseudonocardiaceae bacterium]|nr:hypothetical protein [Pseudonocardiaceae bacterium]
MTSSSSPRHISIDADRSTESTRRVTPYTRSLLAIDVEKSTTRTNPQRGRVRETMYDLLEDALQSAGITGECCDELMDRGDGVIAIVRPVDKAPKTLFLATVVPTLSLLLAHHNADHPDEALRMRAVMHAGEVHFDGRGWFGEALDLSCRLLNARKLKQQLAGIGAPLVLVVSEAIYTSVVCHGYDGIDEHDFEPLIRVQMAGRRHRGWVNVPETTMIPTQRVRPVTSLDSRR